MNRAEHARYFDARETASHLGPVGRQMADDIAAASAALAAHDALLDLANMEPEQLIAHAEERMRLLTAAEFVVAEIRRERARPGRWQEYQELQDVRRAEDPAERARANGIVESRREAWEQGYQRRAAEWPEGDANG